MKITREAAAFRPVTIVLESKDELDILWQITRLDATIPNTIARVGKQAAEKFLADLATQLESIK